MSDGKHGNSKIHKQPNETLPPVDIIESSVKSLTSSSLLTARVLVATDDAVVITLRLLFLKEISKVAYKDIYVGQLKKCGRIKGILMSN